jgi:probable addiction module antidote protein
MAEALDTKEDILAHLAVALEENDVDFLLSVLNSLARAKGMTEIARSLGLTREGLYKSLSPQGRPAFETVLKTLDNLGFKLRIEEKKAS